MKKKIFFASRSIMCGFLSKEVSVSLIKPHNDP